MSYVAFVKLSAEVLHAPPVCMHSCLLRCRLHLLHRGLAAVYRISAEDMAAVVVQIDEQSAPVRLGAKCAAKAMMLVQWVIVARRLAAQETGVSVVLYNALYFHSSFSRASSCGVAVSTPTALQSCTMLSISRAICLLSYVDEP